MNAEDDTKRMLSSLDHSTWPIAIAAGLPSEAERSSVSAEVTVALDMERERAAKLLEAQVEEFDGMPYPAEMDVNEVLKMLTRLAEQIRSGDDG